MNIDAFGELRLPIEQIVGSRIAVLGIPNSGKSYTSRVLAEEWLRAGLPLTIVDIDGEYYTLADQFPTLEVYGGSHGQSFPVPDQLAARSFTDGVPVILDFSDSKEEAMFDYLLPYFEQLWELTAPETARKPYAVFIEEAHEFVSQRRGTPIKRAITNLAARGRKRGVTTVLISQRSQKVDKDALTACSFYFLHEVIHPNDLATYQALLPIPARRVQALVGELRTGQAIYRAGKKVQVISIRQALTRHAGATPEWKRRRAEAADGLAVYPPSPSIVAMVQQQRRLPEHFQRANLSIAENNVPVYAARLRELLHGRQEARARRMLNVYADTVWRAVALRQSLETPIE